MREEQVAENEQVEEVEEKKSGPRLLTAEEILAADDIKTVDVEVEDWGGTVRLRMMTGEEAVAFAEALEEEANHAAIQIVAKTAVKDDGSPLFPSKTIVKSLMRKGLRPFMVLQREAMKLNGLRPQDKGKEDKGNS